jgi:hypothetical protein
MNNKTRRPGFLQVYKYLYGDDENAKEKKGHSKGNLNRNSSIINNMYDETFAMVKELDNGLSVDLPYEERQACWKKHMFLIPCPPEGENYPTKDVFLPTKLYPTVHLLA